MKTLEIKNSQLVNIINLIGNFEFKKSKAKRGKAKLVKSLSEKYEEFQNDLNDIQKEYYETTEDGEVHKDEEGQVSLKEGADTEKLNEEVQELLDEKVVVNLVEHETKIKALYEALDNDEFSEKGETNDFAFDLLMDKLEEIFKEEK